jgi:hypothetical protein
MLSRRQALAGLGFCTLVPGAAAQGRRTLVFVFSRRRNDPYTQMSIRIYTEALGRLGLGFEFLEVPPNRATAMAAAGEVDGELGRTREFAALYPTLVRVEEWNTAVLFSAYAVQAGLSVDGWDTLRRSRYTVGYRLGIKEIEHELEKEAYRGRTEAVNDFVSGLQMLQRGRIDLYADVQNAIEPYLVAPDDRLDPDPALRPRVVGVLFRTTGHAYLHERHRELAPQLSAVLHGMKREGLHERYAREALMADASARGVPLERANAAIDAAIQYLFAVRPGS